ncbi:MAG: RHS repeat domain-containing protein, partial [Candidatus Promineifilaceae bacterium]
MAFDNGFVREYEPGCDKERSTYFLGGQAIATRVTTVPADPDDGLYYLLPDHLGSVSQLTDAAGAVAPLVTQKSGGSDTQSFSYDHLGRLLAAAGTSSSYNHAYDLLGNLTLNGGVSQSYNPPAQPRPHAISSIGDGWSFSYDGNGNMSGRDQAGSWDFNQFWDAENRLIQVHKAAPSPAIWTTFRYDAAGQRVATRVVGDPDAANNGLYFVLGDQLGSVSALATTGGNLKGGVVQYFPFGKHRALPTTEITDRGFTGHKHNNRPPDGVGLIYMNARFYVPAAGRFASADGPAADAARRHPSGDSGREPT